MALDVLFPNGQVLAIYPYTDDDAVGPIPITEYRSIELDYVGGANAIYIGMAGPGSSQADAVWQIRKCAYDGNNNLTEVIYANGSNAFNQIWANRAALTYT